jgi:hypothetical protein
MEPLHAAQMHMLYLLPSLYTLHKSRLLQHAPVIKEWEIESERLRFTADTSHV